MRNHNLSILFPKLNKTQLHIFGYSDASFANNSDLSSQLGFIVFIGDDTDNVITLIFRSYKARRICRSAMASELISFSNIFDAAFTTTSELATLTNRQPPLRLFTDNKSLLDSISKGFRTSEKRLMLDITAARQGYRSGAISDIVLVTSAFNLADGLTKPMSQTALRPVQTFRQHTPTPTQWILRPSTESH